MHAPHPYTAPGICADSNGPRSWCGYGSRVLYCTCLCLWCFPSTVLWAVEGNTTHTMVLLH